MTVSVTQSAIDHLRSLSRRMVDLQRKHFPHHVYIADPLHFAEARDWLTVNMGVDGIHMGSMLSSADICVRDNARYTLNAQTASFVHAEDAMLFKLSCP